MGTTVWSQGVKAKLKPGDASWPQMLQTPGNAQGLGLLSPGPGGGCLVLRGTREAPQGGGQGMKRRNFKPVAQSLRPQERGDCPTWPTSEEPGGTKTHPPCGKRVPPPADLSPLLALGWGWDGEATGTTPTQPARRLTAASLKLLPHGEMPPSMGRRSAF